MCFIFFMFIRCNVYFSSPQWRPICGGTVCMFTSRKLIWPANWQPSLGSGGKASYQLPRRSVDVALMLAVGSLANSTKRCMWWLANSFDNGNGSLPNWFPAVGVLCVDWHGFPTEWIITRFLCVLLTKTVLRGLNWTLKSVVVIIIIFIFKL